MRNFNIPNNKQPSLLRKRLLSEEISRLNGYSRNYGYKQRRSPEQSNIVWDFVPGFIIESNIKAL